MEKVRVSLNENSYDIIIGDDILGNIGKNLDKYKKVVLISNETVGKLYSETVIKSLKDEGKEVHYFELPDGEKYKSIDSALKIYDFMLDRNFDRGCLVLSLGGGVICDLSGYVAATYMRGIDFVQIPTSLLAQVDASVGGKVAINLPKGKNLIGAFHQPKLVYIDTNVINTLSERDIKTGLAEIVKHSIIYSKDYYDFLVDNADKIKQLDSETMIEMVRWSCEIKADVVSKDEKEMGIRAILNYGHTFAHAVETLGKYEIYRHGEAVSIGMKIAALLARDIGIAGDDLLAAQDRILDIFDLERAVIIYNEDTLVELMKKDKKAKNNKLKFILPKQVGSAEIFDVSEEDFRNFYRKQNGRKIKAVIDIGTNTCRLFIAEVEDGKILKKYKKFMEITRLGEEVDKNGYLLETAMDRTVETLKQFSEEIKAYGVKELMVHATSATRDASNRDKFMKFVKDETGLDVECISGEEEARLSFDGALDEFSDDIVLVDIGGGSTEFIHGNKSGIDYLKSFNVGSVRLKEKFFKDENYKLNMQVAKSWVEKELEGLRVLREKEFLLVGVAGTITTQVSVLKEMEDYNSDDVHKYILKKEEVESNLKKFMELSLEERKNLKGLHPKRAEVIVSGTLLVLWIMEILNKTEIIVSENDILEGMMKKVK